jgi:2',3'-cyclic-nucleotide 2'-phosphodiesterase (5'-nucleotidase family)
LLQTVGNHEWDKGLPVLKRYIDAMHNNTVLGANIDFRGHELKNKIKPYVIKWVKGRKVGGQPNWV